MAWAKYSLFKYSDLQGLIRGLLLVHIPRRPGILCRLKVPLVRWPLPYLESQAK